MLAQVRLAIALALLQSGHQAGRDLPLTVKPAMLPSILKGQRLVSASEYPWKQGKVTRVFRYSFRADYDTFVARLRKEFPNWEAHEKKDVQFSMERDARSGPTAYRAVIVNRTRLIRDENAPSKCRPLWDQHVTGWVWVSYNEGIR